MINFFLEKMDDAFNVSESIHQLDVKQCIEEKRPQNMAINMQKISFLPHFESLNWSLIVIYDKKI